MHENEAGILVVMCATMASGKLKITKQRIMKKCAANYTKRQAKIKYSKEIKHRMTMLELMLC